MPVPEENPITVEKVDLGRRLFHDRRLSRDGRVACASCHDPRRAFSSPQSQAVGVFHRKGRRNAPALINRGWGRAFFWDGRITTLEEQVLRPIQDPNENRRALSSEQQRGLQVFRGRGNCTACHVGPTFSDERLHNTGIAWQPSAARGSTAFRDRAPATTSAPAIAQDAGTFDDPGRFIVTNKPEDRGAFKTPTLREVARTRSAIRQMHLQARSRPGSLP
jgi:cytochrome c peroxidase